MAASDHLNKNQIRRGYSIRSGRLAGEIRFPAPDQTDWYHGTNAEAADKIVKSQKLYGDGDFGRGGYLASDDELALDWTGTEPDRYKETGEREDYPAIVHATLNPKRPYYGRGEGPHAEKVMEKLKRQGNDVWFPLNGALPRNPGGYAVILDENAGKSAKFTLGELPFGVSYDYEDDEYD